MVLELLRDVGLLVLGLLVVLVALAPLLIPEHRDEHPDEDCGCVWCEERRVR